MLFIFYPKSALYKSHSGDFLSTLTHKPQTRKTIKIRKTSNKIQSKTVHCPQRCNKFWNQLWYFLLVRTRRQISHPLASDSLIHRLEYEKKKYHREYKTFVLEQFWMLLKPFNIFCGCHKASCNKLAKRRKIYNCFLGVRNLEIYIHFIRSVGCVFGRLLGL